MLGTMFGLKFLGFRWSKKAKITLETVSFWRNISISILKLSPVLYKMKAGRWNRINFLNLANALIRKEKKQQSMRLCFITGSFEKPFKMINNNISLFHKYIESAIFAFCCQDDIRNIKRGNWERHITIFILK